VGTDPDLALRFCETLFDALTDHLSDPLTVLARMAELKGDSEKFREEHFCKGCVLPIVDAIATDFLGRELSLTRAQIHKSLRCEGVTTLKKVYTPGPNQSGFSGVSWGTNFQRINKQGRTAPPGHRGFQACPDFGIVHSGDRKFSLVGETKIDTRSTAIATAPLEREIRYYVALPSEPDKNWDYDFGFGIAYAAGGAGMRRADLITDFWQSDRFVIAYFRAQNK
jgi:hypothetical protein